MIRMLEWFFNSRPWKLREAATVDEPDEVRNPFLIHRDGISGVVRLAVPGQF